jgi:hypothetical protein
MKEAFAIAAAIRAFVSMLEGTPEGTEEEETDDDGSVEEKGVGGGNTQVSNDSSAIREWEFTLVVLLYPPRVCYE